MKRQSGYTLIEVIIAFALLALALVVLLAALSRSTRQIHQSEWLAKATLHAQTLLAQQGTSTRLRLQRQSGTLDHGQFQWTLITQRYHDPLTSAQLSADNTTPQLIELILQVRWEGEPQQGLTWRTLRYTQQSALEQQP